MYDINHDLLESFDAGSETVYEKDKKVLQIVSLLIFNEITTFVSKMVLVTFGALSILLTTSPSTLIVSF